MKYLPDRPRRLTAVHNVRLGQRDFWTGEDVVMDNHRDAVVVEAEQLGCIAKGRLHCLVDFSSASKKSYDVLFVDTI